MLSFFMLIIKQSHEENNKLVLQFERHSAFPLYCEKSYKFSCVMKLVEVDFAMNNKSFILHQARKNFSFDERKKNKNF